MRSPDTKAEHFLLDAPVHGLWFSYSQVGQSQKEFLNLILFSIIPFQGEGEIKK